MKRITGLLEVTIEPPSAQAKFQVDGQLWMPGDALIPGTKTLRVEAKGFVTEAIAIEVLGGEQVQYTVQLKKPRFGALKVIAPKRGWFDILYKGKKLCSVPPTCERLTLPAGTQTLELRSVGVPQKRRVQIKANSVRVLDLSR